MSHILSDSFRPFSKLVSIGTDSSGTINLTDTAGNLLECTYVLVYPAIGIANTTYFYVVPSGISSNPPIALGNGASGTFGYSGNVINPVEIHLGGPDKTSAVTVGLVGTGPINFIVVYGVSRPINVLKLPGRFGGI